MTRLMAAVAVFFFLLGPANASDVKLAGETTGAANGKGETSPSEITKGMLAGSTNSGATLQNVGGFLGEVRERKEKEEKILSFIDAVFPNQLWGRNRSYTFHIDRIQSELKIINSPKFPEIFRDFALRTEGMPQYGGLNKWTDVNVPVFFGWGDADLPDLQATIKRDRDVYLPQMEPVILESISNLNKMGPINLEYIPYTLKNQKSIHGIHVIPLVKKEGDLSSRVDGSDYHYSNSSLMYEEFIRGGVRFSPGNDNQVEGYFLPDKKNQIKLAVCYINVNGSANVLKSYITECLLRSLGIPNILWGSKGILSKREPGASPQLSVHDIEILKFLYSGDIEAGDDKYEVIKKLTGNR